MALDMDAPKPAKKKPAKKTRKLGKAPKKTREQMTLEEKLSRPEIKKVREAMEKKYGSFSLSGYQRPMPKGEFLPTGFKTVDHDAIGGGLESKGFPRGEMTQICGVPSAGKSTFTIASLANMQKNNNAHIVYIDLEGTTGADYCIDMGMDVTKMDYCQPMDGDEAVAMFLMWAEAGVDAIVLDSLGEMDTKEDIDRPLEGNNSNLKVSGSVHLIKRLLMKSKRPLKVNNIVGILINQVRIRMNRKPYESMYVEPGGARLNHKYALKLFLSKGEKIKESDKIVGININIKVEKSKVGPPLGVVSLPVMFGKGISQEQILFEECVSLGIITKAGSIFSYAGDYLGRGKKNAREAVMENPELLEQLKFEVENHGKEEEEASENILIEEANGDDFEDGGELTLDG